MANLILPDSGISGYRPHWPYRLNKNSSYYEGLAFYLPLGGVNVDLVSGKTLTPVGTPKQVWEGIGASGGIGVGPASYVIGASTGYSLDVLPNTKTTDITQCIWMTMTSVGFYAEQVILNYGGHNDGWAIETTSAAGNYQILINGIVRTNTGVTVIEKVPQLVGLRRKGTTWQYFVNGLMVGTTDTTNPNTPTTGIQVGYQTGDTRQLDGNISNAMGWTRALTDNEIFGLWKPDTRWQLSYQANRRLIIQVPSTAVTKVQNVLHY